MNRNAPHGIALLFAIVLAGCQHTGQKMIMSSKPAVELRAIQSRAFETTDQTKMMRTIVATLQDLGYKIDKIEPAAGSVTGTKLSALRMTASVYPRGTTQLIVRSNAIVRMPQQAQTGSESQVDDPVFYQQMFFEPLSKALFLTALQVEDDPGQPESTGMAQPPASEPQNPVVEP